jgi:Tol biopolymer transport system component
VTPVAQDPSETSLRNVRQLTFGGENAEAYWSFDGRELILQRRTDDNGCDRIFRMPLAEKTGQLLPVSSGKGATTCSYFLPGDQEVLYASTHLGGDACPPKPDHSQGYVWALYDSYDIFRANKDGSNVTRLTDTKGYDAEATVCSKDGSIIFTSTRDGDIDLYRMDRDGKNVRRLTNTPGYDGGAFFNKDCTKIVWRASRPKEGKELDDFRRLLAQGLVRPSKLELYTANADGSEPVQLTYLNAASFAPFWDPTEKRVLFSSNVGDPKGREFDIWSIGVDGGGLERVTYAKGFDGFPMFSPDGKTLAFASNRATAEGKHDTNVFLADWVPESRGTPTGAPATAVALDEAAARVRADVATLAAPSWEGRGIGTQGLAAAGAWIEARMRELGLTAEGDRSAEGASFRQAFKLTTGLKVTRATVTIAGKSIAEADLRVTGLSPRTFNVKADLVNAGYGIVAEDLKVDDYKGLSVRGKVVLVRRFVPADAPFDKPEAQRRHGDLRRKAWLARERGAAALVVVDEPLPPSPRPSDYRPPTEAKLPPLEPEGYGDAGIPVMFLSRAAGASLFTTKTRPQLRADVVLEEESSPVFNVVGRIKAGAAARDPNAPPLVIGAHYDHLGMGGRNSLAPGAHEAHVGADDNASGTAALLEVARTLSQRKGELARDVLIVAFSGEEAGVLGSTHFVRELTANSTSQPQGSRKPNTPTPPSGAPQLGGRVFAMLNMDMVGRMRQNHLDVLGTDSALEWQDLVRAACDASRVHCTGSGDGYGPSDQTPFFAAGVPVLHFFTGAHSDYHKPSDTADRVNVGGLAKVAETVSSLAITVATRVPPLSFKPGSASPPARGDMRSFNASLGTIPDYAGPGPGKKGVLLAGVRAGGAAEKAGMTRGDVLIKLGTHDIGSVEDLMFVLSSAKPNESVEALVLRDGKTVKLNVTFQEGGKR